MASGEKAAAGGTNPEDHTNANKTDDNLPLLCVVLVGPAGVGKSTFGNATLGLETAVGSNQGFVMSNRHNAICTSSAEKRQGPWLGQTVNERIEVIDLPGYHGERHKNTKKHRTSITDGVKDKRLVHAFIFLKTADHPALDDEDRLVLQMLQGFFGSRFFGHLFIVVTGRFSSSEKGGKEIKREIQKKIKKSMSGQDYHDIPIFFIDALHDTDQPDDVVQYKESMKLLWKAIRACSEQPLKNFEILMEDFSKLQITVRALEQKLADKPQTPVTALEQKVANLEEHMQVLRSRWEYLMEEHTTGAADWNQPMDAAVVGELANPSPPEIYQATPEAHAAEIIPPPITSLSLQTSLDTTGGNSSEPVHSRAARPAK